MGLYKGSDLIAGGGTEALNDYIIKKVNEIVPSLITKAIKDDNMKKYYVGCLLLDTKNVNPSTYLGFGTWEYYGQGRCLVGVDTAQTEFNTVGKTGGSKTVTLNVSQIPSHYHEWFGAIDGGSDAGSKDRIMLNGFGPAKWWNNMHKMNSVGGNQPHTNLQPYITVYVWKRTA